VHPLKRLGKTLAREEPVKKSKNKVQVNIKIPIHHFGFFTFKEFGFAQKEVIKESPPIYVFPKSTAAIAQV
jgi:hypothetical protein